MVQGTDAISAKKILDDVKALEEAGAFAVLLENVPEEVDKVVTEETKLITFGIEGGPYCDGRLLLSSDILGLTIGIKPWFAKSYANLRRSNFKRI